MHAVVGLLYLGAVDLDVTGAGESRAAKIAREMYQRGNYLLPSLRGEVIGSYLTGVRIFIASIAGLAVLAFVALWRRQGSHGGDQL
jgi:hypothetical protein